jgi:hypothetical protein
MFRWIFLKIPDGPDDVETCFLTRQLLGCPKPAAGVHAEPSKGEVLGEKHRSSEVCQRLIEIIWMDLDDF